MLIQLYAVKDIKVSEFQFPFFCSTAIDALRNFTTAVRQENSKIGQFPQDFELHQIGELDTVTGKSTSLDTSKFIQSGQAIRSLDEEIERSRIKVQEDAKRIQREQKAAEKGDSEHGNPV